MKLLSNLLLISILITNSFKTVCKAQVRDPKTEQIIEKELEKMDPSMLSIFKEATIAMDQNNLKLADSLYALICLKHPTFDPALRRLGGIRFQLGNIDEGLKLCKEAVNINRSAYNLLSLAICLSQPGKYQDLNSASGLLEEANTLTEGKDFDILAVLGQIQLQNNNVTSFRKTVDQLQNNFPDKMVTHFFNAILSVEDKKWTKAKAEIDLAKEYGLSEEVVNDFLSSGVQTHIRINTYAYYFLWIFLFWVVGMLLLFIAGKFLSQTVMSSIDEISKIENISGSVKATYRWLINIGGIYYYFSLPIILVLVVCLAAGLTYIFLLIGRIPIQLMLMILVGSVITIYGMIRSLIVKTKYVDPGRILKEEEAVGLYALVREVAQALKTRPIDEIRITYGTDLAVYEKGTLREKQQDTAKRILILGAAVIGNFQNAEFRAILAHEYGHFSNRDTAGGEVALRVNNDMQKYLYALYSSGQNVWWNVAFQFLRLYNFLFRRISFGSTRLQEILADKVAAGTYGAVAFQNGLTHVIKRDIEFNDLINQNVEEIRNSRPSINVYNIPEQSNKYSDDLEKLLTSNTSEDDTHPSPRDRFKLISDFILPTPPSDTTLITNLFSDWAGIQNEMREYIDKQISKNL